MAGIVKRQGAGGAGGKRRYILECNNEALIFINEARNSINEALIFINEALIFINEARNSINKALIFINEARNSINEALIFINETYIMSASLLIKPESPHPAKATLRLPSRRAGRGLRGASALGGSADLKHLACGV
ncbi:hypothetical protein [Nostoc sp.]|uniref:hypothetical protein n=1 Tax=Nostoc sp. TaxID=1180 RepID=UPI002FFAAFEF